MDIPPDFEDPDGRQVDHALLGRLMGAAYDECGECQPPLIDQVIQDGNTSARFVELGCLIIAEQLGGLPASLTDPEVPGTASVEFRRLAAAGVDGQNRAMWEACRSMTPEQRRAAVSTALDLLVGSLPSDRSAP